MGIKLDNHDITAGKKPKLIYLEAARGVASIAVIFWHFSHAFLPEGLLLPFWQGGVRFTPILMLLNGPGAVSFFFVLSGFVLTLSIFRRPSARALVVSAGKRLPRLMVPCAASILIGYAVLKYGVDYYQDAGRISQSKWLMDFGSAHFPLGDFSPTILSALQQSFIVFIVKDNFYYNSNLWTMRDEFFGSILAFCIAGLSLIRVFGRRYAILLPLLFVATAVVYKVHPPFGQFIVGATLSYAYSLWGEQIKVGVILSTVMLVVALIGFSTLNQVLNTLSSVLVVVTLLGNHRLSALLSGRIGCLLGKYSFPLYLAHTIVILTISSAYFLFLSKHGVGLLVTYMSTMVVTLVFTALLSLPFSWIEEAWVPLLNRLSISIANNLAMAVRSK